MAKFLSRSFGDWTHEAEVQNLKIRILIGPLSIPKLKPKCYSCSNWNEASDRKQSRYIKTCFYAQKLSSEGAKKDYPVHQFEGDLTLDRVSVERVGATGVRRALPVFKTNTGTELQVTYTLIDNDTGKALKTYHAEDKNRSQGEYFSPAQMVRCLNEIGETFEFVQNKSKKITLDPYSAEEERLLYLQRDQESGSTQ